MALSYLSLTSLTSQHFVKKKGCNAPLTGARMHFTKKYILWLGALEEEEEFFVYNFSLPQTSPGIPCFFPHQNQLMPVYLCKILAL